MRCYCLTSEAEKRPDAATLVSILKRINVVRYHWRRTFVLSKRNQRYQRQRLRQALNTIPSWEWHAPAFAAQWKPYFSRELVLHEREWVEVFRFRMARLFEVRVLPRMVFELPVCDPEVESRLAEIEGILADPTKSARIDKLNGLRRWRCMDPRKSKLERLAKRRVRAAILGDLEAERMTSWCHPLSLQGYPALHISVQSLDSEAAGF